MVLVIRLWVKSLLLDLVWCLSSCRGKWSLLRIQLIPNYSYMLGPNCWFSMDFGDLSSAPPHLLSIRSHGLISSFRQAFSEGFPAALLISIFVSLSGPCCFAFSAVFPDSPGFLSDTAFLSYLRSVIEKLVTCWGKTLWKMMSAAPCFSSVIFGLLWNEGVEISRERVFPKNVSKLFF